MQVGPRPARRRPMTDHSSIYREIRPLPELSGRLVCLWSQRVKADGPPFQQRVLPDGCVDIVWIGDAPPLVAGPATRHMVVDLPAGVEVLGLRMRPGQAGALLGLPADRLLDANVPLADFWGGAAADRLGEAVQDDQPVARKLGQLADALMRRTAGTEAGDPAVGACIAWLAKNPGGSIDHLADVADLGLRQLRRRFRAAVGYGPKTFQRIVRLQRLLDLSDRPGSARGLAALSDAAGYADQAHMSREVRDLTGQVPSLLLAGRGSTLAMSDLFKTDDGETG